MKLSIITPFHNSVSRLGETALAQFCNTLIQQSGLKNFRHQVEHVWIDDGSSDNTHEILARLAAQHPELNVQLLRCSVNRGPGAARNTGIAQARGKWIAYIDSDDTISGDRVSELRKIVGSDREMFFSPYRISDFRQERLYDVEWELKMRGVSIQQAVELGNPSVPIGVCHTKDLWKRAGGFPENVVCGEDGILWRRMINRQSARVGFLQKPAGTYFVRPDSQSRTRRRFDSGNTFDFDTAHPLGANGQYLDVAYSAIASASADL